MGEAEYEAAVIGPCVDELRAVLSAGFNYIENPHRFDQEAFLKLADALCACRKDLTYLPGYEPPGGRYQAEAEDREASYGAFRSKGPHPPTVMDEWNHMTWSSPGSGGQAQ